MKSFCLLLLSGFFTVTTFNVVNAGCGTEPNGHNCVDVWSHYQRGTSLPCVGDCGGCVYTFCGPIIE